MGLAPLPCGEDLDLSGQPPVSGAEHAGLPVHLVGADRGGGAPGLGSKNLQRHETRYELGAKKGEQKAQRPSSLKDSARIHKGHTKM